MYGGEKTDERQGDCRQDEQLGTAPVSASLEEEQRLGPTRNLCRWEGESCQAVKPGREPEEGNAPGDERPGCGEDMCNARGARKAGNLAVRDIQAEEASYYAHW